MKSLTDARMASYWQRRLQELKDLRPLTQNEAANRAKELRKHAEELYDEADAIIKSGESTRPIGRMRDIVRDRLMRSHYQDLASTRLQADMLKHEAHNLEMRADSMDIIANEPMGNALKESIEEAKKRFEYYRKKAGSSYTPKKK